MTFAESHVFLDEVHRVLRPVAYFLISVNQAWRTHDPPNDYYRFTQFGLKHVLEKSHLTRSADRCDGGAVGINQYTPRVLAR